MNLLKTLFSTPVNDTDLYEESVMAMRDFPADIEPLWKDFERNQAQVTETITPNTLGRVKFQGTWWRALSDRPLTLEVGTIVRVIGRQRCNILIVEPLHAEVCV